MKEIEAKILIIDRDKCEKTLRILGAKKTFEGEVQTTFYDFPDKSIQRAKNLLRLRKIGRKTFLTCKKYVQDKNVKIRKEYEIEVSDYATTNTILRFLNVSPTLTIRKLRTSYVLDKVHFEIDTHLDQYAFIPVFLEIEAPNLTKLYASAQQLGYTKEQCKPWSFFDVAAYYTKKKKRTLKEP
jgi:predicted adenylyl cyclase CyaB